MASLDQARATQLANIEARTGKTLVELRALILGRGTAKHSELRAFAQEQLGLTYGDANSLIHFAQQSDGQSAAEGKLLSSEQVLDELYAGDRAPLRPLHDLLIGRLSAFGAFETVPKKGYVSLRRGKQFAMAGPANKSAIEIGLNLKDQLDSPRAKSVPPPGMCQYKIRISMPDDIDPELVGWLGRAYEASA